MNVLALVALFTGAFLVFSTQALGVVRRRAQFAMLRVLGLTRGRLLRQILMEGALLGLLGFAVRTRAGLCDGKRRAAFFRQRSGRRILSWRAAASRFRTAGERAVSGARYRGVGAGQSRACAGSGARPAGRGAQSRRRRRRARAARHAVARVVCLLVALVLTQVPPLFDAPIGGYLAVALLLVGGIALDAARDRDGIRRGEPCVRRATLASGRDQHARARAARECAGACVDRDGRRVVELCADRRDGDHGGQLSRIRRRLAEPPAVRRSVCTGRAERRHRRLAARRANAACARARHQDAPRLHALRISRSIPARPDVAVLAREIDAADPGATLQMTGAVLPSSELHAGRNTCLGIRSNGRSVWIQARPARAIAAQRAADPCVRRRRRVARLRAADRRDPDTACRLPALTGDTSATDVAVTVQPGASVDGVIAGLRALPFGASLDTVATGRDSRANAGDFRPEFCGHLSARGGRDRHRTVRRGGDVFRTDARARSRVRHVEARRRDPRAGSRRSSRSKAAC